MWPFACFFPLHPDLFGFIYPINIFIIAIAEWHVAGKFPKMVELW